MHSDLGTELGQNLTVVALALGLFSLSLSLAVCCCCLLERAHGSGACCLLVRVCVFSRWLNRIFSHLCAAQ